MKPGKALAVPKVASNIHIREEYPHLCYVNLLCQLDTVPTSTLLGLLTPNIV